jgi:hypothetical protein
MVYFAIGYGIFVVWTIIELVTAPWGYEDSEGFHIGKPDK